MPAPDFVEGREASNNKGRDSPECLRFSQASIAVTRNRDDCGGQTIHLHAQNNDNIGLHAIARISELDTVTVLVDVDIL